MDLATVAVVGFFISLAGREVELTGNLLVEEDVAHRFHHVGIESEGELSDVPRTGIRIQNFVELFCLITGRLNNFTFFEVETNTVEGDALINRRRVKSNVTFD